MVELSSVHKSFYKNGHIHNVLKNISFDVKAGEIVTLLGKSGCGKSTLLNLVGGFMYPDVGRICINNKLVKRPDRNCVTLFQQHNLLPWRNVFSNVLIGITGGGLPFLANEF